MAVTLTVAELRAALRLNDSAEETAEVSRLHAYATEAVTQHAPDASETAKNEAVRRLSGYLFDMPEAGRGMAYANAMRNSGAARMLLPYRVHRAGYADAVEAAQEAVGSVPSGAATYTLIADGVINSIKSQFNFLETDVPGIRTAWETYNFFEFRFELGNFRYTTRQVRTVPQPLPATAIQIYAGLVTLTSAPPRTVNFTIGPDFASIGTGMDGSWIAGDTLQLYGVS